MLSAGWISVACVGNFINALFLDRLGRIRSLRKWPDDAVPRCSSYGYRIVLIWHCISVIGISGCVVFVIIEAAIVKNFGSSTNQAALAAGVAMLFGFIVL